MADKKLLVVTGGAIRSHLTNETYDLTDRPNDQSYIAKMVVDGWPGFTCAASISAEAAGLSLAPFLRLVLLACSANGDLHVLRILLNEYTDSILRFP